MESSLEFGDSSWSSPVAARQSWTAGRTRQLTGMEDRARLGKLCDLHHGVAEQRDGVRFPQPVYSVSTWSRPADDST
jgi:hypothetical protein